MKALFLFFGALTGLLSFAQADIVIYKGTFRIRSDIASDIGAKPPVGIYLLVDFDARQSTSILTFRVNGEKKFVSGGTPGDQRIATAEIKGGKTMTIVTNGSASSADPANFNYFLLSLRGVNTTFTIRQSPTLAKVNRPRLLSGSSISLSAQTGSGRFQDALISLSFQANPTLKANNAGKTLAEVLDEIISDLKDKGFVEST